MCVSTGNPLTQEIMSLYQEPDGTRRLLNYLLDNLAGAIKRSRCLRQINSLRSVHVWFFCFFVHHFLSEIASWTVVVHVSQYSLLVLGDYIRYSQYLHKALVGDLMHNFPLDPIGFCLVTEIHYCLKYF